MLGEIRHRRCLVLNWITRRNCVDDVSDRRGLCMHSTVNSTNCGVVTVSYQMYRAGDGDYPAVFLCVCESYVK